MKNEVNGADLVKLVCTARTLQLWIQCGQEALGPFYVSHPPLLASVVSCFPFLVLVFSETGFSDPVAISFGVNGLSAVLLYRHWCLAQPELTGRLSAALRSLLPLVRNPGNSSSELSNQHSSYPLVTTLGALFARRWRAPGCGHASGGQTLYPPFRNKQTTVDGILPGKRVCAAHVHTHGPWATASCRRLPKIVNWGNCSNAVQ